MINRNDMLELTRRMNVARTSLIRVAGCYMDRDGEIDGTFNTSFLKLKQSEKEENLAIAKTIPFAGTNEQLREYTFTADQQKAGTVWQLLMAARDCGLKNDALLDIFYDCFADFYKNRSEYAVMLYYGCYDIPNLAKDRTRLGESENIYEYLICAVCPLVGDYEPGRPECGFLFPGYGDRSALLNKVDVFFADPKAPHGELLTDILRVV